MNNILKTIALSAAVILSAAACSKWTEQKPVDFNYLTPEEKNPALYEAYLQSIRDYRSTEHQVLIARFDNKSGVTTSSADHINCLPDSVDYVVLNDYNNMSVNTILEMKEIREKKAVSTLIALDYAALDKEHKAYLETAEPTDENADSLRNVWFAGKAKAFVSAAKQFGVEGIMVSYTGKGLLSLKEDELAATAAFQEAFFAPILEYVAETGKLFFYEGNPTTLIAPQDVLPATKYIIVPAESVTTIVGFNFAVMMSMGEGIPSDRFVIGVTALNITDETATDGLFSGDITAIEGAAGWAVLPSTDYVKAGICVNHVQYDYYKSYRSVSTAISTMNPSPIK